MKLHEVLESGKKFRRKKWPKCQYYYVDNGIVISNHNYEQSFDLDQGLADDWEIFEEEKIELTESQIREAWRKMIKRPRMTCNELLRNLGFNNV